MAAPRKPAAVKAAPAPAAAVEAPVSAPKAAPAPVAAPAVAAPVVAAPAVDVKEAVKAVETKVAEVQENVRKATEQGVEQTRAAYAKLKTAADAATASLETSYSVATKGVSEFNAKAIDALQSNTLAAFDFVKALAGAKSVSEAITLQTEHARKQYEAVTAQAKELAEIAKKVATDSAEPIKAQLTKG